jgi:hypothetical protein
MDSLSIQSSKPKLNRTLQSIVLVSWQVESHFSAQPTVSQTLQGKLRQKGVNKFQTLAWPYLSLAFATTGSVR